MPWFIGAVPRLSRSRLEVLACHWTESVREPQAATQATGAR
jgi:hypothetical protein